MPKELNFAEREEFCLKMAILQHSNGLVLKQWLQHKKNRMIASETEKT
jgi:hypothetical protein